MTTDLSPVSSTPAAHSAATSAPAIKVALIGNPNTGKSTVFTALAGLHTRIGNYPGVTVEKKIGRASWQGRSFSLVDLPGTYSLSPRTLDELVSVDVLLGRQPDVGNIDAVVCVVDASNLERNFYLFSQVLDLGLPTVLVLNMRDVAAARGIEIDVEELRRRLGVAVVETEAHRGVGIGALQQAIAAAVESKPPGVPRLFPPAFYEECERLGKKLAEGGAGKVPHYLLERMLLDVGGKVEAQFARYAADLAGFLSEARERLRAGGCGVPAVEARVRYAWAREVLAGSMTRPAVRPVTFSDKLDHVLTHRFVGLAIFAVLMFVVFQAIYQWAGPLMEWIEAAQGEVASLVESFIPPGALRSLLVDGVIAGVGGVIVFLPQIAFLFFFIAILEDCGYMARAAFLMDKLMTRLGLSGKSFVPLMSSFACAIPGVMATRVIENRRDRMVTILVAPLMSCSARLPVYLLLIGAFIPPVEYLGGWITLPGLVLLGMSSLGAVVAVPVAWVLRRTFFRGETPPFVMELPTYKWPSPRVVAMRVYDRAKAFVVRAGTLIFATSLVVWGAGYFPGDRSALHQVQAEREQLSEQLLQQQSREEAASVSNEVEAASDGAGVAPEEIEARLNELAAREDELSGRLVADSFLGRMGKAIEPAVRPLGWDWRIGVGAIASFPAREVIISTLGTIYSLGGEVDEEDEGLRGALQSATWPDGRPVYNVPVALSIMVFFALCAQCAATLMVIKRETNSWRWPAFTFAYMTALAYTAALLTYQVAMLWA